MNIEGQPSPPVRLDLGHQLTKSTTSSAASSRIGSLPNRQEPSLREQLLHRLLANLQRRQEAGGLPDHELEIETAAFIRLVSHANSNNRKRLVPIYEFAVDILTSENPDLPLVRDLRCQLELAEHKAGNGLSSRVVRFCGPIPESALFAAIAALMVSLGLAFTVFVLGYPHLTGADHVFAASHLAESTTKVLPVIDLLVIISAAFVGSLASMMLSIGKLSRASYRPLLIFFTTLFKPFIAILFCIFIYGVLESRLVSLLGVNIQGAGGLYLLWVVGFLCGFSERFVGRFVSAAKSRLPLHQSSTSASDDTTYSNGKLEG